MEREGRLKKKSDLSIVATAAMANVRIVVDNGGTH